MAQVARRKGLRIEKEQTSAAEDNHRHEFADGENIANNCGLPDAE